MLLIRWANVRGWSFPGGYVKPNESVMQAAVRETLEMTGVEVELTRLLGVYSRPNWRKAGHHQVSFVARPVSGEPRLSSPDYRCGLFRTRPAAQGVVPLLSTTRGGCIVAGCRPGCSSAELRLAEQGRVAGAGPLLGRFASESHRWPVPAVVGPLDARGRDRDRNSGREVTGSASVGGRLRASKCSDSGLPAPDGRKIAPMRAYTGEIVLPGNVGNGLQGRSAWGG